MLKNNFDTKKKKKIDKTVCKYWRAMYRRTCIQAQVKY